MSRWHACEIERLHGEWLLWTCRDAADECLVRAFVNRAFASGLAGCNVTKIRARYVDRGCRQSIKTRNVDFEYFSIPRASVHATRRSGVYLGIRCQNVLQNAMQST